MDFLEDLERYEESMENAYLIITKKLLLEDLYETSASGGDVDSFYLPFNPLDCDGRDDATIDLVVEHFSSLEDYEKCADLAKIKKCLKTPID